jgi:predicted phage terminase large subunit-like protein
MNKRGGRSENRHGPLSATAPSASDRDRIFARNSPAGFAYVATRDQVDPFIPADFHAAIAESIVDIEQGRLELLVTQVAVQHGKSTTASQWGLAWMLGLHPTWNVIAATYNTDFAEDRIGRPTRDILERHGASYFGVGIDPRSHSMKRWNTTQGGGLLAVGVEKPVAGRPADAFVIDDPYPSVKEAMNPQFRADVWEWFRINILPRRKPVLRMVAIMSRWHEDDFIAQLINLAKSSGWNYRVLDYPAISICRVEGCDAPRISFQPDEKTAVTQVNIDVCDHNVRDELGRLPGEALWPQVRPIDFLKRQLLDVGLRMFLALFQGRPQRAGGSIFRQEWFRYFDRDGDLIQLRNATGEIMRSYHLSKCRIFEIVDLASGDTQTLRSGITRVKAKRDFTAIGIFALCPGTELAVLEIYRNDKIEGPDQIALVAQLSAKHRVQRIGIEAVAYQWTAVQAAVRSGLPAVAITRGQESKETRAWTIATRYEVGMVFHLRGAPWLDALETELVAFPNGPHDDQVDVLSDAGDVVAQAVHRPKPHGVYV